MKKVRTNSTKPFIIIDNHLLQLSAYFQDQTNLYLKLNTKDNPLSTIDIPSTSQFLLQNYPTVLQTQCFNPQNLPFSQEIHNTEIGHLFEHILIQLLIDIHVQKSPNISLDINGVTSWNWTQEPRGIFHINISNLSTFNQTDVAYAISNAYKLTKKILSLDKTVATNIN